MTAMTKMRQRSRVRLARLGQPQPARADRPMPNLSDHDLKQIDHVWLDRQPESVVRGLLRRTLDDLRLVRSQLSQTPDDSFCSLQTIPAGHGGTESASAVGEGWVLAPSDGGELEGEPDREGEDSGRRP